MLNLSKIISYFARQENSILIVDLSSGLKLLNIDIKPEAKITFFKSFTLQGKNKGEEVVNAIKFFIQEQNIQSKNAILNPPLDSLIMKRLQLPAMPYIELADAIKWQLKDDLGADYASATLDFSIIKEFTKPDGAKALDIACVAAKYNEIKERVLCLKQAGLNCLAAIPTIFGYGKIITKYLQEYKAKPVAVIHLGEAESFIGVFKDSKLEFFRELPVAINKFREALSGTLATNRGMINLTKEDIDSILFEYGISFSDSPFYKDKIAVSEVLGMLRSSSEKLVQETKRSLIYYTSQLQGEEISSIYISGLGAKIPNVDKFLTKESGLNIQKIPVDYPEECIGNIGLSLGYEHNINLLPHEFRTEKFEKLQKLSLRWFGFIAFLLLVVFYIFTSIRIGLYQKRLSNGSVQLNILSEVRQIKTQRDTLSDFIIQTRKSDLALPLFLRKLSAIVMPEVILNNLSLQLDAKTGLIDGSISSMAKDSQDILSKFVQALEATGYIADATVVSMTKGQDNLATNFNITLKLE
jgi:type IV pilus assembly protein PilM